MHAFGFVQSGKEDDWISFVSFISLTSFKWQVYFNKQHVKTIEMLNVRTREGHETTLRSMKRRRNEPNLVHHHLLNRLLHVLDFLPLKTFHQHNLQKPHTVNMNPLVFNVPRFSRRQIISLLTPS